MRKIFTRIGLAVGSLFALGLLFAAPSFAAGGPSNTGQMPVSVAVNETISVSINAPNAFAFGTAAPGTTVGTDAIAWPTPAPPAIVTVSTNDNAGYTLTAEQNADLSDGTGDTIPATDETLGEWATNVFNNNAQTFQLTETPSVWMMGGRNTVAAGDAFGVGLQLAVPAAQAAGSYGGQQVTFTATGN